MLNIPNDQLPEEWQNKERITVLYSPLRSRTVNPKDWDTKITSWQQIIYLYCLNNKFYKFTQTELLKKFERNGHPPSSLPQIIDELLKTKELWYLDEFQQQTTQTWSNWFTDVLIRKPLKWSINNLINTNRNDQRTIIHYRVIREESQKLFEKIPKNKLNKLLNLQELLVLINEDVNLCDNIKLLLIYLKQQRKVDYTTTNDQSHELLNCLVKFGQQQPVKPITEIDISIHVLEQNEKTFVQIVEQLEDEINTIQSGIKQQLLTGHRQLAKANLRKKHEIQKRLDRKLNALHNIQILLEKLHEIQGDTELWAIYKQALIAFNKTFKDTGLNEEKVENTLLELEEILEITNDIQNTISRPIGFDTTTNDADLEQELEDLIKIEGEIGDLGEQFDKLQLPEVPTISSADQEPPQNVPNKKPVNM